MMSGVPFETCWAFNKRWNNKFYYKVASCWLFLLIHTTMHGSINSKKKKKNKGTLNYRADITITGTLIFVLLEYYTKHIYTRGKNAPFYRHWGSVQAVRPMGGVEVQLYSFTTNIHGVQKPKASTFYWHITAIWRLLQAGKYKESIT